MTTISLRFIGSGDAFGSGGRMQTCILVDALSVRFCIDFGATSLVALRQANIDPNSIDAIFLTHLHGDHCGGVPFLLLDAMLASKRASPLAIIGPRDVQHHLGRLQEALFPGSQTMSPKFALDFVEIEPGQSLSFGEFLVSTIAAKHTPQSNPLALRFQIGQRSLVFTGDGELTDALIGFVQDADLLVTECYGYTKPVRGHLSYPDVNKLSAQKIILTHMHTDMLAHSEDVPEICAYDGLVVEI